VEAILNYQIKQGQVISTCEIFFTYLGCFRDKKTMGDPMTVHIISDDLRSNFHLFWDNFPFPVMLTPYAAAVLSPG